MTNNPTLSDGLKREREAFQEEIKKYKIPGLREFSAESAYIGWQARSKYERQKALEAGQQEMIEDDAVAASKSSGWIPSVRRDVIRALSHVARIIPKNTQAEGTD